MRAYVCTFDWVYMYGAAVLGLEDHLKKHFNPDCLHTLPQVVPALIAAFGSSDVKVDSVNLVHQVRQKCCAEKFQIT